MFSYTLTGCLGPWELAALQAFLAKLLRSAWQLLRSILSSFMCISLYKYWIRYNYCVSARWNSYGSVWTNTEYYVYLILNRIWAHDYHRNAAKLRFVRNSERSGTVPYRKTHRVQLKFELFWTRARSNQVTGSKLTDCSGSDCLLIMKRKHV